MPLTIETPRPAEPAARAGGNQPGGHLEELRLQLSSNLEESDFESSHGSEHGVGPGVGVLSWDVDTSTVGARTPTVAEQGLRFRCVRQAGVSHTLETAGITDVVSQLSGVLSPGAEVLAVEVAVEPSTGQRRVRGAAGWVSIQNMAGQILLEPLSAGARTIMADLPAYPDACAACAPASTSDAFEGCCDALPANIREHPPVLVCFARRSPSWARGAPAGTSPPSSAPPAARPPSRRARRRRQRRPRRWRRRSTGTRATTC
jgi:hypothetical protein